MMESLGESFFFPKEAMEPKRKLNLFPSPDRKDRWSPPRHMPAYMVLELWWLGREDASTFSSYFCSPFAALALYPAPITSSIGAGADYF